MKPHGIAACMVALATSVQGSPAPAGVEFDVVGFAPVNVGKRGEEFLKIEWQRQPTAPDFPKADWSRITHEATFNADCKSLPDGTLTECKVTHELPAKPSQRPLFQRALQLLRVAPASLAQLGLGDIIFVGLRLTNPVGTDRDKFYCGEPFCIAVPPPPPPPRPE